MHTLIHAPTHIYACTFTQTHKQARTHVRAYAHADTYTHTQPHTHACAYEHAHSKFVHMPTHITVGYGDF